MEQQFTQPESRRGRDAFQRLSANVKRFGYIHKVRATVTFKRSFCSDGRSNSPGLSGKSPESVGASRAVPGDLLRGAQRGPAAACPPQFVVLPPQVGSPLRSTFTSSTLERTAQNGSASRSLPSLTASAPASTLHEPLRY